jgi:hypothetical protein
MEGIERSRLMCTPHLLIINETRRKGGRHVAEKYRVR